MPLVNPNGTDGLYNCIYLLFEHRLTIYVVYVLGHTWVMRINEQLRAIINITIKKKMVKTISS